MRVVTLCGIPGCCSWSGVYNYITPCMYTFRTDSTRVWTSRGYSSQIFSIFILLVIKHIWNLQARLLLGMNLHEGDSGKLNAIFHRFYNFGSPVRSATPIVMSQSMLQSTPSAAGWPYIKGNRKTIPQSAAFRFHQESLSTKLLK